MEFNSNKFLDIITNKCKSFTNQNGSLQWMGYGVIGRTGQNAAWTVAVESKREIGFVLNLLTEVNPVLDHPMKSRTAWPGRNAQVIY
jgi:hypothetical protein